jgi:hypothetical protein|tara:strand:- start:750 stop:1166 length:417 start_codon:yes stop_codon:yes gene_type:complete
MRLYNVKGRLVSKNVSKYLVDWEAKSRSKIQKATKDFLVEYWRGCVVYEEFPVYGTRLKVDILNASRMQAVEVQGDQHIKFNKFFHSNSREKYLDSISRDMQKHEWLEQNNFQVIEIYQKDIPKLSKEWFEDKFGTIL